MSSPEAAGIAFMLRRAIAANPDAEIFAAQVQSGVFRSDAGERAINREFARLYGMAPPDYREFRLLAKAASDIRGWFFHGTSTEGGDRALADGFNPGSCWGTAPMAAYYAEEHAEQGRGWTLCAVAASVLDDRQPDIASIQEPLTTIPGITNVQSRWERSRQDAAASLRIVGSFVQASAIEPGAVRAIRTMYDVELLALSSDPPIPARRR